MIKTKKIIQWYPKHALSGKRYDKIYCMINAAKTRKQLRKCSLDLLGVLYDMDERLIDLQTRVNEQGYKIER